MVTWSFIGLLLNHSWKWFLQISLSIGHIVPFKMTLLSGTKMILKQKGRWFLTTNSQFAILTDLSAHEQYGLCLIMPNVFWFLKLQILTLDTAKPELLFFLKCTAFPLCCLYDHFIYFPSKKRKTISDSLLCLSAVNKQFFLNGSQICPFSIATAKFSKVFDHSLSQFLLLLLNWPPYFSRERA